MCTVATNNTEEKCSDEEMFNWSASTQFWESPIGILLNKYESGGALTPKEKETLQGWYVNNAKIPPKDLCM